MKGIFLRLLVLSSSSIFAADLFDTARLTMEGFGPVRIGMTLAEARGAGGEMEWNDSGNPSCGFLSLPGREVGFMVENGKVTRIDIGTPKHSTLSGVAVGDSEGRAQAVYKGRLEILRHAYDDNGHYLILKSQDRKSAVVFETDGKRIITMRAGLLPSVGYIEGCL